VFTARFGPGPGPVRFDRICHENGIRHLLTARCSPTTTGKVERLHKTMRTEHFALHEKEFATLAEAQAALDAWVVDYNTARPHQAVGMRPPIERFRFAQPAVAVEVELADPSRPPGKPVAARPPGVTRWVDQRGLISLARFTYRVGPVFAGQLVEAVADGGLVQIYHQGVLIATHAQRLRPEDGGIKPRSSPRPVARAATSGPSVIRIADNNGNVSFAGTMQVIVLARLGVVVGPRHVAPSVGPRTSSTAATTCRRPDGRGQVVASCPASRCPFPRSGSRSASMPNSGEVQTAGYSGGRPGGACGGAGWARRDVFRWHCLQSDDERRIVRCANDCTNTVS